jgi:hypothetical protein
VPTIPQSGINKKDEKFTLSDLELVERESKGVSPCPPPFARGASYGWPPANRTDRRSEKGSRP